MRGHWPGWTKFLPSVLPIGGAHQICLLELITPPVVLADSDTWSKNHGIALWECEEDEYEHMDDGGYVRHPVPHQHHFILTQLEVTESEFAELAGQAAECEGLLASESSQGSSVSLESFGLDTKPALSPANDLSRQSTSELAGAAP